jgi:sec-independent protein translocase protein TatB
MFPSGIGFGELVVIGIVLLLVVGPKKLPDVAKDVGKGLKTIRKVSTQLRDSAEVDEIKRAVYGEPGHTPAWKRPVSEHLSELLEGDDADHYKAHAPPPPRGPGAVFESRDDEPAPARTAQAPVAPPVDADPDDDAGDGRPVPRAAGPAAAAARAEAAVRTEAAAESAAAPAAAPAAARDDAPKSA